MPTSSRGSRPAFRNIFKVAWMKCERSFCCCFTIRTGASMIGWFDFIFNSLYVGMLVFALARASERLDRHISFLKSATRNEVEGSSPVSIESLEWTDANEDLSFPWLQNCKVQHKDTNTLFSCICEDKAIAPSYNSTIESYCFHLDEHSLPNDCMCSLRYISYFIMPLMYRSIAIPGSMIVLSVLWLTAVESSSIKFIRIVGYALICFIPLQLGLQLYYQIYAGIKFQQGNLGTLHPVVWAVYVIYAIVNIYFLPILYRYIKLRLKECAQGIEQGLLTSERYPPSNRALDVYLEDAFSIEADIDNERFRYSIDDNDDDDDSDENNVVEYDFTKRNDSASPTGGTVDTTSDYQPLK